MGIHRHKFSYTQDGNMDRVRFCTVDGCSKFQVEPLTQGLKLWVNMPKNANTAAIHLSLKKIALNRH